MTFLAQENSNEINIILKEKNSSGCTCVNPISTPSIALDSCIPGGLCWLLHGGGLTNGLHSAYLFPICSHRIWTGSMKQQRCFSVHLIPFPPGYMVGFHFSAFFIISKDHELKSVPGNVNRAMHTTSNFPLCPSMSLSTPSEKPPAAWQRGLLGATGRLGDSWERPECLSDGADSSAYSCSMCKTNRLCLIAKVWDLLVTVVSSLHQ